VPAADAVRTGSRLPTIVVLCILAGCAQPPPANVILIVVDALRADHLAHYGYQRSTSTGLDGFAADATRFTDCRAPAPWTNPSVASLFTGLHTARHRNNAFGAVLSPELKTLAEALGEAEWHTAAVSFNPGIRSELDYDQGFDDFDEFLGRSTGYPDISEMLSRVDRWLEDRPDGPFFLYLQPMNVHGPYRVPREHRGVLLGRPPSRDFRYSQGFMQEIMREGRTGVRPQVPPGYVASLVDKYDTAVRYTSDRLGELMAMLRRRELYDDSLIIITADHGEELFDHGGFSHGYTLHSEVLHVPLYIKLPRQTDAAVTDAPASLMDIMPTILDVAGVAVDPDLDGRSLLPLLQGRGGSAADGDGWRLFQVAWRGRCEARAIAVGGLKLIEIAGNYEGVSDEIRLYDHRSDPGEAVDIAGRRAAEVEHLRAELGRRFAEAEARAVAEPQNRRDLLDTERLKALGYVE